jgi:hypothetical protein
MFEYKLTKLAGLRWRVTVSPRGGTFTTSSLDEALAFIRQHIAANS